jgi:hypothetical protein
MELDVFLVNKALELSKVHGGLLKPQTVTSEDGCHGWPVKDCEQLVNDLNWEKIFSGSRSRDSMNRRQQ